jgi:hypothetical protein
MPIDRCGFRGTAYANAIFLGNTGTSPALLLLASPFVGYAPREGQYGHFPGASKVVRHALNCRSSGAAPAHDHAGEDAKIDDA